jgi:ATP-dependent HslUV protease ATP-binding subunit HslU
VRIVEKEMLDQVRAAAEERAIDRLVDTLQPRRRAKARKASGSGGGPSDQMIETLNQLFQRGPNIVLPAEPKPEATEEETDDEGARRRAEQENRVRDHLREQIQSGVRDDDEIEIEVEENVQPPFLQVLTPSGMDDSGDLQSMLGSMMPKRRKKRKTTIKEAREIFANEEARSLVDQEQVSREAITRAEQDGIIFVDEMDKVAGRSARGDGSGPDVSREGVQRDILPIIEGSTVHTKYGQVKTDFILFIAAGAFHISKPSDLIPELQGRLPIRVELESLTQDDFKRILTEPRNAMIKQYTALLETEGVDLTFTDDAVAELARIAAEVNAQMENIGARRLHTIMERLLDEVSYAAPDMADKTVHIDGAYVREKLEGIVKNEDLSRYIL